MPTLAPVKKITAAPSHPDHPWPAPVAAPLEWFTPPAHMVAAAKQGVATHNAITPEGRIYGHTASFKIPLTLPDGRKWYLPKGLDLARTMRGHHTTAEGQTIPTGLIMTDRSHTDKHLPLDMARDKFGFVGNQLGIVNFGYDEVGLWHAGTVAPGAKASAVVAARAGDVSGEWFPIIDEQGNFTGEMEFLGAQACNIGAFELPQSADRNHLGMVANEWRETIVASMLPPRYSLRMAPKPVTASVVPAGSTITWPDGTVRTLAADYEIDDAAVTDAPPDAAGLAGLTASIEGIVARAVEAAFTKMMPKKDQIDAPLTPAEQIEYDALTTPEEKAAYLDARKKAKVAAAEPAVLDPLATIADTLTMLVQKVDAIEARTPAPVEAADSSLDALDLLVA